MADSQTAPVSEDEVEALVPDTEAEDSSPEGEQPEYDLSALRNQLSEVASTAATRVEVENLKRQAGHVPALQRQIAELEGKLARYDKLGERLDAYEELLIDALPIDKADQYEQRRSQQQVADLLDEKIKPLYDRLDRTETPEPEAGPDLNQVMLQAQADAATAFVHKYANDRGIDPADIPAEVYQNATVKHKYDFMAASEEVLKYIDEQQATVEAPKVRRQERKDAAAGGNPAERDGSMGKYDMNTLAGITMARKDGAISSEDWYEKWTAIKAVGV